ncbi:DUF2934 domain-containing protein [Rhizobium calliandrae]|uniref:DUF2934 domain-containing protein n=1 Tax=Rhizobium calliandrae TaxID=1312182 RepID=A0ABT7KKF3_9HYPH|nr:DUF2934 domain-containing protein [Rhizobium calliandrae]MDL2409101.1 DUF2934 domain-containing protein [Rhizobium calliandrae]
MRSIFAIMPYMLWLEDGQPEGKADEHWHRARDAASANETPSQPKSSKKKVS